MESNLPSHVADPTAIAEALQQSEARFRAIFDSTAIGIGLLGLDGRILQVNAAVCAISGYSVDELLQRNDRENVYPEDRDIDAEQARQLVAGEIDVYQVEKRYMRKDGRVIWARLSLSSVRGPDGKPQYLVGLIEDITEQKHIISELQESEARFRAVFESPAIGVGVLDVKTMTIRFNDLARAILQGSVYEQTLESIYDLVHVNYRQVERGLFEELVNGQRDAYQTERRYMRPDGSYNCALVTFSAVRDASKQLRYVVALIEDITERTQAQEQIKQSEARFRAAFESSAIGMALTTPDGHLLRANQAVCQMSGYTEAELQNSTDFENTYPADRQVGFDLLAELLAGQRDSYQVEKRYVRKNGQVFWTRLTLSAVRDAQGKLSHLVSMVEDIDEQKRVLEELQKSEARFRTLFTTAAVGIGILSLDRKLIDANPALCEMYGYDCNELVGNTSLMVTHPDDYPRASAQLQRLLNGECDSFFDERRYIRKNGEAFWAHITMSLVRDDHGQPLYIVGLVNDIDEQKKAQDTLRDSEARFRAMFDNAAIGMAIVSLDRKVISANQTVARLTGYPLDELIGVDPSSFTHPDDRNIGVEPLRDLIEGKVSSIQLERRYLRKDGNIFWGRVAYSAVPGDDGKPMYLVGSIEDITEEKFSAERLAAQETSYRRTLEQRIAERTDELNKANQLLQQKAAQEAVTAERTRLARDLHDAVTQTLFSATLIADVLPDIWEMNPAEGKRRLEEVRQLTRGALAEMRTLLVELRPNALVEVPLPTLLRQLTDAMAGRSRISIQISAEGERKLPGEVQIGLYRIAQEALNNVVKHARASQAVVTLRLGETVRLAVADNGSGFDPSNVTADHLGLKIMRERAEMIGTKLAIYSEPGEGTQISVTWS